MIELNPKHYSEADIASIQQALLAPAVVQDKDPAGAIVVITEVPTYQTVVVITEHPGW